MNIHLLKGLKVMTVVLLGVTLNACSAFDRYAEKTKNISVQAGQSLGLMSERKMQVPSYYSTENLPKKYAAGEVIQLQDLACKTAQDCSK